MSRPQPGTAKHDVEDRVVRTEPHVQAHVQSVLACDEVAKSGAAGGDCLVRVLLPRIAARDTRAAEADQAEAGMQLPAQFNLNFRRLVALVAQSLHAPQPDVRSQIERRPVRAALSGGARREK